MAPRLMLTISHLINLIGFCAGKHPRQARVTRETAAIVRDCRLFACLIICSWKELLSLPPLLPPTMARSNQRPSDTPAALSLAPSSPSLSSDKENQSASAARDKGKGRMQSQPQSGPRAAKRRRTQPQPNSANRDEQDYAGHQWYDPTQDQHERQEIKKRSRALEREFNGASVYMNNLGLSDSLQRTRTSISATATA